ARRRDAEGDGLVVGRPRTEMRDRAGSDRLVLVRRTGNRAARGDLRQTGAHDHGHVASAHVEDEATPRIGPVRLDFSPAEGDHARDERPGADEPGRFGRCRGRSEKQGGGEEQAEESHGVLPGAVRHKYWNQQPEVSAPVNSRDKGAAGPWTHSARDIGYD